MLWLTKILIQIKIISLNNNKIIMEISNFIHSNDKSFKINII